ncbi:2,3-bisphosphoglycerate-independent phosphoglycerate mutase [Candidatus Lokiarchaeum ossiferum]|uniref:2,3-bisphosphoglycerate-independent phosphoglycerate mutase n=1 Tax=Candidatus Lokiarchaeum ossiferum TaxID=2951803 RepID=A0ABY6HLR7_9ARCH|nr:2,3-bisphosphoglycerate-independent phosphoglycerate mutase [Candidatus Lokiarchaeum sp. B-35]
MDTKEYHLEPLPSFRGRKGPLLVIIMDGVGIGKKDAGDAFYQAHPTNLNTWMSETKEKGLYTELRAHGIAVGLPTDGDMGNSEVGHNALGAGQVFSQGARLVNDSLETGEFFETENWDKIVGETARTNQTIHLIGLLSDGNVHSHIEQLFKILDGIVKTGVKKIRIHPLLDGRDVPPDSGLLFINQLEEKLKSLETDGKIDAKIGSGGGRMYVTMDRYESNWDIVKRGWNAHVRGFVDSIDITKDYPGYFTSATKAIETARKVYPEKQDQYNPPFVIVNDENNPIGKMNNGDAVINFNFRGDRAIEISKAFIFEDFAYFDRIYTPDVKYSGLLEYDGDAHIPTIFLVPPPKITNISAKYFTAMKIPSFAIAETHKFGHVTYFWNGNNTGYINSGYELYEEIKSEPNEMIESHPEMRADEVTERLLQIIQSKKYKYIRVNYANGDMVGHTGNIKSCIRAVKKLDECLKKVVDATLSADGIVVITADHGNVEEKLDKKGNVKTSHTLNPVPFFILDSNYKGEYQVDTSKIEEPGISNVIATVMNLMGYQAPGFYEKSLINFN